ncbi:MAG: tRNA (adenosine(37)-N6)-dimethylallyltransferase MiaA [Firmicutes bacterium]|nr:tRNA (adenosine(37)-N6)-dimethylallyltransferase MiaA [Bacillota bacterium]
MKPKIISVVGLTASGKTGIGIKLAKLFNGEVISADSRQVYRGLDLGTGKVKPEETDGISHHLIDIVNPGDKFDVFKFQQLAFATIEDVIKRGKLPIIVGGTGLYSRAVVEGYQFQGNDEKPEYDVLQIALMPPKDWIKPKIKKRLEERIEQGMVEETKNLLAQGVSDEWLRSLGLEYFWNTELIDGKITMDEYKYWLYTKITQFAKRQRTWFKREQNTHFLENYDTFLDDSIKLVKEFL